jgi:hypothetical protein
MARKKEKPEETVFQPGGARRLLEDQGENLTDDERALLLALISVDAEAGKSLGDEGQLALEKLRSQLEDYDKGYDVDALTEAAKHMVTAKPKKDRKVEWPELKRRRKPRSAEE